MSLTNIFTGTVANDGTGTNLRASFEIINANNAMLDDYMSSIPESQVAFKNEINTFVPNQFFSGDVTIGGDLFVQGTGKKIITETINSESDYIYLRYNNPSGLAAEEYTGIEAVNYDGVNNGQLVFGADGYARVGDVGSLVMLAGREDSPTDGGYVTWNDATKIFETETLATTQSALNYWAKSGSDISYTAGSTTVASLTGTTAKFQVTNLGTDWEYVNDKLSVISGDVHLALVSDDSGTKGSSIGLKQVDGTTFENVWGIYRETNGNGTGDGCLHFAYGYDVNETANADKLKLSPTGLLTGTSAEFTSTVKTEDVFKIKGTDTGLTSIATANTSATDYTATLPAKTGTIAMTSDIVTEYRGYAAMHTYNSTTSTTINTAATALDTTDIISDEHLGFTTTSGSFPKLTDSNYVGKYKIQYNVSVSNADTRTIKFGIQIGSTVKYLSLAVIKFGSDSLTNISGAVIDDIALNETVSIIAQDTVGSTTILAEYYSIIITKV